MDSISIISASVRVQRESHRAALFFNRFIQENNYGNPVLLDLQEYNFPLFQERLNHQAEPLERAIEFQSRIKQSAGVIIVTPEYNGGYPASLKNVIDLLYPEWYHKPVGIVTVSDGVFGGTQVITSLQFTLWKMKAWTIPAMFPVPNVKSTFSETGVPLDKSVEQRASLFIKELKWCIEAVGKMN